MVQTWFEKKKGKTREDEMSKFRRAGVEPLLVRVIDGESRICHMIYSM